MYYKIKVCFKKNGDVYVITGYAVFARKARLFARWHGVRIFDTPQDAIHFINKQCGAA